MRAICLIIFYLIQINCKSQEIDCNSVKPISEKKYSENRKLNTNLDSSYSLQYTNEVVFKFGDEIIDLKDDFSNVNNLKYYIAGVDSIRNWFFIKGETYNQEYFFLYNYNNLTVDTLLSYPIIFDDLMVCFEPEDADKKQLIQFWKLQGNKLTLKYKFKFNKDCDIYPVECIISKTKKIMIKDNENRYWIVNN